ncbi:hypothetical protein H4R26_000230 [Coemansia thaxteri]|uniref:MYND-type domain-containing protein n=1 Tax=Coemansia thaxteri TaxID=2663907 RepID=A0A9W8EHP1_9FUNG|nr:hypothetical protein H4R26_000230 [Coemansia thaxteri]KAJ2487612.1 hypothetical protein EV174_000440 [Coemansia sp. RSA 2320]
MDSSSSSSSVINDYIAQRGLRLEPDAAKGQRTVATRMFRRGDVLLSIPPLAVVVLRHGEDGEDGDSACGDDERCSLCLAPLPARHPRCGQCRATAYCSGECLAAHWAQRHHFECSRGAGRRVGEARVKAGFRPLLRMALGVERALLGGAPWVRVQAAAWARLVSHRSAHPRHVLRQYAELARVLGAAEGDKEPGAAEEETINMLCRFGCNNFAADGAQLCSPVVSLLLNHSCAPNATYAYTRDGLHVVWALDDIAPGAEVSLAYVDVLSPRSTRCGALAAVYFFDCACARCAGAGPRARLDALLDRPAAGLPRGLPTDFAQPPAVAPWVHSAVAALLDASDCDERLLRAVAGLPPADVSFAAYTHWRECLDDCLARGPDTPWAWATVAALHVLAFYAMAYPRAHPLLGRHCLRAAQLAWNAATADAPHAVADARLARDLALAARAILRAAPQPPAEDLQQIAELLAHIGT